MIRRTIALVVSLALMQASGWGLICTINCNHHASAKHAIEGGPEVAVQHHSHQHHDSMASSACCPASAQVVKHGCVPNVPSASAVEGRLRVNFDSVATVLTPIFSALAAHSEAVFFSSSPPASFLRTVASNLRI